MKLIELLVQELPKRGGWPEGAEYCWQDWDTEIRPVSQGFGFRTTILAENNRAEGVLNPEPGDKNCVTREQYEAALNAKPQLISTGVTCEAVPKPAVKQSAHSFLEKGVQHMKDRAAQRDSKDGERSMKACVDAFNAMFGHNLTETQGWQFMVLLKMARSRNKFNPDDYEDGAAYTGLAGEAHSNEQN